MRNVVLLTVDSLRADHCSYHGYERATTPELDALAEEAATFTRAYAPSSHTRESVAALLSGRYPHAAVDDDYHLAAPTLATRLADTHVSAAVHSNPFLSRAYGYDRDFDAFDDDLYLSRHKLVALAQRLWDKVRGHHYVRAETVNERALSWLDSLAGDDPFFLWNHYMDPHGPYEPPEPYRSEFLDGDRSDRDLRRLWSRANETPEALTADDRTTLVDAYDGEVRYTDAALGAFLDALDRRGLLADSLVVVTADHGELLGEGGRYSHPRRLDEELLHVPLVVSGPAVPAATVETPAGVRDLRPTIADLLGGGPDGETDRSLARHWTDAPAPDAHVVSEARSEDGTRRRYRVTGPETTLSYEQVLGRDVGGDLDDREPADLAATLRAHLDRVAETAPADDGDVDGTDDRSEVAERRLEALGYK